MGVLIGLVLAAAAIAGLERHVEDRGVSADLYLYWNGGGPEMLPWLVPFAPGGEAVAVYGISVRIAGEPAEYRVTCEVGYEDGSWATVSEVVRGGWWTIGLGPLRPVDVGAVRIERVE
jgi:hypothetical protein